MERMLTTLWRVIQAYSRNDDDLVDRLHHRYTVIGTVVFAVVVTTQQYVGTPISCWAPAYFIRESHERYADRICWVSSTYYLLEPGAVPGHPANERQYINYYQWVPVILMAQALMFKMPCLFWRVFSDRSGININNLVEAAETIQNALYPERREKTIRYMIRHLDHYLDYQRDYRGGGCDACQQCLAVSGTGCLRRCVCGNRRGNYLIVLYITTKLLYLINVVGQFYLLDSLLGGGYHFFGIRVVADLIAGRQWTGAEKIFPRVTLCDFRVYQMGNVHPHKVQCVLPINFFSEKIYLVLWYWMTLLGALTVVGLLRWLWVLMPERGRRRYVRQNLKIMSRLRSDATPGGERDRKLSRRFTETYLRQDGVFVLKLVAKNSTDLVVADIVAALWDNYRTKPPLHNSSGTASHRPSTSIAYIGDAGDMSMEPVDIL